MALEDAEYDSFGELVVWLRERVDTSDFIAAAQRIKKFEEERR